MKNKNGSEALEQVALLEQERQQAHANFRGLFAHVDSYRATALSAHQRFATELTKESVDNLLLAESLLAGVPAVSKLLSDFASNKYVETQWRAAHPELRDCLREAATYKLNVAEKEALAVRVKESRHLSSADVEDSPPLKRARGKVKRLG
jgi:hypothetical protein